MHIPDGFLSTPVWLSLDVVVAPIVGYAGRFARKDADESKAPLLGVMGAFVFAAQMINFPVGLGVSGHLVGGALLAYTLGAAPAVIVLTAILSLQALVFQDGGLLALGANIFNMAIVGVGAAYLPYRYWGAGSRRRAAMFLGGALSVFAAACLALTELLLSGIQMSSSVLLLSLGLFLANALAEGVITVAVIEALNRLNPEWVRRPARSGRRALGALAIAALLLTCVGVLFASAAPDGIEQLAEKIGIRGRAFSLWSTPLAGYRAGFLGSTWGSQVVAGLAGLALIVIACLLLARLLARRKSA